MLITSSAYLENVFLFTLTKTTKLFLFVQGSRPSFGHGGDCYDRQDLPAPQQDGRAAGVRQQTWLKESQTVYNPAASPTDRYGRFG